MKAFLCRYEDTGNFGIGRRAATKTGENYHPGVVVAVAVVAVVVAATAVAECC